MAELFNKTFFRFTFGFIAIIVVSVLSIVIVGYYDFERGQTATAVDNEECKEGENC